MRSTTLSLLALCSAMMAASAAKATPILRNPTGHPASLPAIDGNYQITINGTSQGSGGALRVEGTLYLEFAIVTAANLRCERTSPPLGEGRGRYCAVPFTSLKVDKDRLDAVVPATAFERSLVGAPTPLPVIPELTPGRLAFLDYDFGGSKVRSGLGLFGNLNAGVRLEKNAFDLGVVVARTAGSGSLSGVGGRDLLSVFDDGRTTVLITDAAYRRNWFDQRLSLAIGRTSVENRGVIGGSLFDGVGIAKDNLDNLGDIRSSRARSIGGYNPTPGVLTYRVGNTVLKQVPLPAGQYNIDPNLFSGLPSNGNIEITGTDGRVTSLDLAAEAVRVVTLFPRGTFDWNVQAGRVRTAAGDFAAAVTAGTRYGFTDDLTGEVAILADTRSAILDASLDARLPGALGVAGVTGAVQFRKMDANLDIADQSKAGWTLRSYYEKRFDKLIIGGDYQRNIHGGTIVGGYRRGQTYYGGTGISGGLSNNNGNVLFATNFLGSIIKEDIQLYASAPLFKTGISGNVRLASTAYIGQPRRARYAEGQLGAGLGRWGNIGTFVRAGRTGYGQHELSANAYWTIPIGNRTQVGLNYQTNRVDGEKASADRYALTINGSQEGQWDQGSNYNASIDQAGNATANYQRRFRAFDASVGVYRYDNQGVSANADVRGSLVLADGQVTAGRALNDNVVVLKSVPLAGGDVFQDTNPRPTTRMDALGNAVVSNLLRYKNNRIAIAADNAPPGLEVPDNVLLGTVHPYRGYIVRVPTHLARPARLFAVLPEISKSVDRYADVNGEAVPVESDGSIYVDDLDRLKSDVTVMWTIGDRRQTCVIPRASIIERDSSASQPVKKVEGLQCR